MKSEFHIWDFPGHEITVQLDRKFLDAVRERIGQKFTSIYRFGKEICIGYGVIHQALDSNRIPLYLLGEMKNSLEYSGREVEKNIVAYRAYTGRKWIRKPKLPILECPELYELMGHIIGDGHISIEKERGSGYTNTSGQLIEHFKSLLGVVFGNTDLTTSVDKRFNASTILLPKPVSLFLALQHPKITDKNVPVMRRKRDIARFIRAFMDDESCVCTSEIKVSLKSRHALEQIRRLLMKLGFNQSWLTDVKKRGNIYHLSIKGKGLVFFEGSIGFKHPDKKKQLIIEVRRKVTKRRKSSFDQTKSEITQLLDVPKPAKELSNLIGIEVYKIREHLRQLEGCGYVEIKGHSKYNVPVWIKIKNYKTIRDQRKEQIMEFLSISPICTREIAENLGLSKDTTMRYLYDLKNLGKISYGTKGRTYFWVKK